MTRKMNNPVSFCFSDSPRFSGFTDGTRWNGYINVAVSPETRDEIVDWLESEGDDTSYIRAIPVIDDLINLSNGYATIEDPTNHDALAAAYSTIIQNEGISGDGDALEQLSTDELTPRQRRILSAFVILWDAADSEAGQ